MALHLKRDDSKAVLPSPEGPLSTTLCSPECSDTLASVGMFTRSLEESRLLSLRGAREGLASFSSRVDNQATPHFAWLPFFRETFFREMLLRDVSRKFLVIRYT